MFYKVKSNRENFSPDDDTKVVIYNPPANGNLAYYEVRYKSDVISAGNDI